MELYTLNEVSKYYERWNIRTREKNINYVIKIIYVFLTIFLYLLKCPQSLILSALRAFLLLW